MRKTVYFAFGGKIFECILNACIFRLDKNKKPYYQAELLDKNKNSVMIANLCDVFLEKSLEKKTVCQKVASGAVGSTAKILFVRKSL